MADETSMDSIEKRISSLERSVYGNAAPDPENKVLDSLVSVHNKLQSSVTGREKITRLFSKLEDLKKYLDPEFKENMTLTDTTKFNLILLEKDRINNAVESLQAVKELIQYLDSEHIKAVPSLCPKLYEVSQLQLKLQDDTAQLSEETRQLIDNYDKLVLSLSKQFILWDSMLSEVEKSKIKKKKIPV